MRTPRRTLGVLPMLAILLGAAASAQQTTDEPPSTPPAPLTGPALLRPDLSTLEPAVGRQLQRAFDEADAVLGRSRQPSERAGVYGSMAQLLDAYDFAVEAESWYRRALILDGDEARWAYGLAFLLQREGDYAEAELFYRRTLELEPGQLAARYRLAEVLRENGLAQEAAAELTRILSSSPDEPATNALLGQIALDLGDPQQAATLLEKALASTPAANRLHYPLALAYRALGDDERARAHLEARGEVGVRPADPWLDELNGLRQGERVHTLSGRMAFRNRRFAEAAEHFRLAVEANPDSPGAHVNLGTALSALGRPEEAAEQFRITLGLEPDNHTARYNLGTLLLSAGQTEAALPHLQWAAQLQPGDGEALEKVGDALRALGRRTEAVEHYRKAVGATPLSESAWMSEAATLIELRRYGEAVERLNDAVGNLGYRQRPVLALIRLLAASPASAVRDGERAFQLSSQLFERIGTVRNAAAVALALSELDRCEEAAQWQQRVVEILEQSGNGATEADKAALERYQSARPCRPPGDWQEG